jgi:hypothetical protein
MPPRKAIHIQHSTYTNHQTQNSKLRTQNRTSNYFHCKQLKVIHFYSVIKESVPLPP